MTPLTSLTRSLGSRSGLNSEGANMNPLAKSSNPSISSTHTGRSQRQWWRACFGAVQPRWKLTLAWHQRQHGAPPERERKQREALQAVADPSLAATKRIAKNLGKRAAKKRKLERSKRTRDSGGSIGLGSKKKARKLTVENN